MMWVNVMKYLLVILLLIITSIVTAQDDQITDAGINYGDVVQETITARSVYDWWRFLGNEGDVVTIRMVAADGLAPLIGISTGGGTVIVRSDTTADGQLVDAPVNGTAVLQYTLPTSEEYTIVATRVGNFDGTTTGSYTLSLNLAETNPPKDLQDVTFRCDEYEITTAATIEFGGEGDEGDYYRVTVYGMDGFLPYLRFDLPINGGITSCSSDGAKTISDEFLLPEADSVTVVEGSPYTAQHILEGMKEFGQNTLIIGSRDGQPGRYVAIIEGYGIAPAGDEDLINVRLGPLATSSEMLVYMLHSTDGRIDPQIQMFASNPGFEFICDDAGRRDCAEVPAANLYQFKLSDGTIINGDRLDAGVKIATGNPDRVQLIFRSRTASTQGKYTIVIVGELPALETTEN
ncbi:MAG: hypothetical protein H7X77_01395 [Anaerolineae bacterium]|nr:hypothetical protein [Anaerolineae bacterium]